MGSSPKSSNGHGDQQSPSPSPMVRFLVGLDRSLILGFFLGLATFVFASFQVLSLPDPFLGHGQFMLTKSVDNWYLPYRMTHGRPMEKCTSFEKPKKALMAHFGAEIAQVNASWSARISGTTNYLEKARLLILKSADTLGVYQDINEDVIALHKSPCTGKWERHFSGELTQKWFANEAPFIWASEELDVSPLLADVYIRFLQILEVVFLFLVVRRMARSSVAGVASVAILATLTQWPTGFWHNNFLLVFPVIYAVQLAIDHRLDAEDATKKRWVTWSIAALIFGIFAAAAAFGYPPQYRPVPQLMLITLVIIAIMRRQKRLAIPIIMFWLAMTITTSPLVKPGEPIREMVGINHAKTNEFAKMTAFIGQAERPNYYGVPIIDLAVMWDPPMFDPLLNIMDRNSLLNQVAGAYGGHFLKDMLLNHPDVFFESLWKRAFLHVVYPDLFISLFYDGANPERYALWWFAFVSGILALALLPFVRGGRSEVLPVLLTALWCYLGVHTLLNYLHTHDYYTRGGAYIFFCITPGLAFWFWRQRSAIIALPGRLGRNTAAFYMILDRRGPIVGNIAKILLFTIVFIFISYFIREAKKEIHAFDIYYAQQNGFQRSMLNQTPEEIEGHIEAIRGLGGNAPGTVDMFGAHYFAGQRPWRYRTDIPLSMGWHPKGINKEKIPEYKARALHLIEKYYRQAIAAAPDNPYFPVYALRREIPEWRTIFRRAVYKFPDSPFAAYMAQHLLWSAPLVGEDRTKVAKIYLKGIETLLQRTAEYRPGLVRIPKVIHAPTAWPKEVEDGLSVILKPGESIHLGPIKTHGSEEMRLSYFLHVSKGSLQRFFQPNPSESGLAWKTLQAMGDDKVGHYVVHELEFQEPHGSKPLPGEVEMILRADDQGAEFLIRDFYPLLLRPKIDKSRS